MTKRRTSGTVRAMQKVLDDLVALLDLEALEVNLFRGESPEEDRQRVFGGQVAGQALVAAGRTVEARSVHSLHAYFLRPGDPTTPILYQVDRIRDGKSFTTRRVVAIQHGEPIFHLSASFQRRETGLEHQVSMPDAPDPEELPTWKERLAPYAERMPAGMKEWVLRDRPIDTRDVDPVDFLDPEKRAPRQLVWFRADGRLPDDPLLHDCIVVYASDLSLLDTALLPHGIGWTTEGYQMASLDHAMWFHRPFRADEWLLYVQESASASGARGLTSGHLFDREGRLVVSVVQEGLIRPRTDQGSSGSQ